MRKASMLRIPCILAISFAVISQVSYAQRGGHRGAGFHAGGFGNQGGGAGIFRGAVRGFRGSRNRGFGGFHNGRGLGGFHNGTGFGNIAGRGFSGFRGPLYGGFGGGYGYNYGLTFNFGFLPFLGGYPYVYGYTPWLGVPPPYYFPYDYPNYGAPYDRGNDRFGKDPCLPDYRHEDRCKDSSSDNSRPKRESAPALPSNQESAPNGTYVARESTDEYQTRVHSILKDTTAVSALRLAYAPGPQVSSIQIRRGVANAMQALRAMPPEARQRQLESNRYAHFSAQERQLLKDSLPMPTWDTQ
ncbi:MAG: hypothetical protein JO356_00160 [Acidobacteria bacterium]|nr:hypothetical protein [Acidobacteriota bacterium]